MAPPAPLEGRRRDYGHTNGERVSTFPPFWLVEWVARRAERIVEAAAANGVAFPLRKALDIAIEEAEREWGDGR